MRYTGYGFIAVWNTPELLSHQDENIHFIASRTYLLFYYEDSLSFYDRC